MSVLIAALLGSAGCSGSSEELVQAGSSQETGLDLSNTRNTPSSIDSDTAADLELAWSLPVEAKGIGVGFTGSPAVVKDTVYLQDPDSNISAIDLGSGEVRWEKRLEAPVSGPNGVVVAQGLVFGVMPTGALALDAKTGERVWSVNLVRNSSEEVVMRPGYHEGVVYVSTSPGKTKGNEVGVLWALDGKTGRRLWHFDTVPRGLWGRPQVNYGGGLSQPPAFDGKGSLYIGTGNPGPIPGTEEEPWGSSRPGPNLYTNSVVKLDEQTGTVEWHYQVTPHGLCNWDVGGPVLARAKGREVVLAGALSGTVVALDPDTGQLLWRRMVGVHNGHDFDGLAAMRGEARKLQLPMTVYPGVYGGVEGPLSVAGSTVFVPVVDQPTGLDAQENATLLGPDGGQLVALDVLTGEVEWKQEFSMPVYGPTLATNDLVFAMPFDGELQAFDVASGERVWEEQVAAYAEGGLTVRDDTLLVRAGFPAGKEVPELQAYRLAD